MSAALASSYRAPRLPFDGEEVLFSVKCLLAGMIAYYVAARIGLPRPYWAVTTSYIVAQPLSGAVLSKAVFRVGGTVLGATAAVLLLPTFVNAPAVLSAALALWLAVCVYWAMHDRTPRSYTFLLAGYTACIIAFPSVDAPGTIFETAVLRVQEIVIGILAGSLVHGTIVPRTVTAQLREKVDAILLDVERTSLDALDGLSDAVIHQDLLRLTTDLADLDQLTIHLPFDTARLLPNPRTVRDLQDQLSLLLPFASTVDDRIGALRALPGGVPAETDALLCAVRAWIRGGRGQPDRDGVADRLLITTRQLRENVTGPSLWAEMLHLNLLARLPVLIEAHRNCWRLRDEIASPRWRGRLRDFVLPVRGRSLHRDAGWAVQVAASTAITILLGCAFWIATAWPDGGQAALFAGICFALFGNVDYPRSSARQFLGGFALGLIAATVYGFVILPRVTDPVMLAAATAPAFLLLGAMLPRPTLMRFSLGALLAFPNTVGLNLAYSPDFAAFINIAIAQLVGVAFATFMLGIVQTLHSGSGVVRLRRACFRDISRRALGAYGDDQRWLDRMLDRVSQLLTRVTPDEAAGADILLHALRSIRIGYVAGELGTLGQGAPAAERQVADRILAGVGSYYRSLDPRRLAPPPPDLLDSIDRGIVAFSQDTRPAQRRDGLVLLTSLRRNLFPAAPGL